VKVSHVYAATSEDVPDYPVKIGKANNPTARLRELQVGNPHKLYILAAWEDDQDIERLMHVLNRDHWIGGEWFRRNPKMMAALELLGGGKVWPTKRFTLPPDPWHESVSPIEELMLCEQRLDDPRKKRGKGAAPVATERAAAEADFKDAVTRATKFANAQIEKGLDCQGRPLPEAHPRHHVITEEEVSAFALSHRPQLSDREREAVAKRAATRERNRQAKLALAA
jgi:hypothetical protein